VTLDRDVNLAWRLPVDAGVCSVLDAECVGVTTEPAGSPSDWMTGMIRFKEAKRSAHCAAASFPPAVDSPSWKVQK
jgi:hypothetical protein